MNAFGHQHTEIQRLHHVFIMTQIERNYISVIITHRGLLFNQTQRAYMAPLSGYPSSYFLAHWATIKGISLPQSPTFFFNTGNLSPPQSTSTQASLVYLYAFKNHCYQCYIIGEKSVIFFSLLFKKSNKQKSHGLFAIALNPPFRKFESIIENPLDVLNLIKIFRLISFFMLKVMWNMFTFTQLQFQINQRSSDCHCCC